MKDENFQNELDGDIKRAIGRDRPKFDFDNWKKAHEQEIQVYNWQVRRMPEGSRRAGVWRRIMTNRTTKLTAAAVIILAAYLTLNLIGGPNMANMAWAQVTNHLAEVDHVHVYWLKSRGDDFIRHFEAWYARGKLVKRGNKGGMMYDDGQAQQFFDEQGRLIAQQPSFFAKGKTFFEVCTAGLLSDENEQLSQLTPINVGDDFLIYEFDPPANIDDSKWLECISVTVGKNSLLPIQIKIYEKDSDDYDLVMFDYEAPAQPPEFFDPLGVEVSAPHGSAEVLLDGEATVIRLEGAPGLKQAVVRLHSKYDGPSGQFPLDYFRSDRLDPEFCRAVSERLCKEYKKKGGPLFRLDVSFVTDEGYRSGTNDIIALCLNEAKKCGVGSEKGGLDNWPDGKYRNIKFSPLLKPTDKEDTYIVELRCWLRSEDS